MTIYQLIIMQFIAHLVVDFLLQSEKWCIEKEKHVLSKQHLLHGVIVAVTAYIFSLDVYFIISALIIGFSHLAIDVLKSYCIQKREDKKASIFFIDQLLHVILLSLVSWIYLKNYTPNYLFDFHLNLNVMTVFAAFLFCAKPDNTSEKELENAGKVIGIMERFMALGLILAGQYGAVGLIIAAKSILRFNS